ncbi:hypothetical protein IMCC20628_00221 [Hoeflea sp. IMCC20628]|uniref:hypothetical protein n=1 Tax=Hoeflea sp. IMCC20628 TaxID=1620421 RepID=UPI00063B01B5|nr:hypothetical protein [Hoeflea sp. IMCC20628]AKH98950.1 hypothetical protein IMCC20628_00221 [Hoeflea sp. IMCC20628]
MSNRLWPVWTILLLLGFAGQSQASNCSVDDYDHNGSIMQVEMCGDDLYISYSRPKASLRKIGIRVGTTLFEGTISRIGAVSGTARRFSAQCGAIDYSVEGAIRPNSILLEGQAPVRNRRCEVTRYRYDELLFSLDSYTDKAANEEWYAVAGAFSSRKNANNRARNLSRQWQVMNSRNCPNFTPGYWVVVAGPMPERDARRATAEGRQYDAYAKSCY